MNDAEADGDQTYFLVTAPAMSADPSYGGLNGPDRPVINTDDETAGFTVSADSGDTTEFGGTATFLIALTTRPSANVTIGLSSSNANEGTVSPSSVTFTPSNWNSPRTMTTTDPRETRRLGLLPGH